MFDSLEYLPIMLAALIATAGANVWHSPVLFGRFWMSDDEKIRNVDTVRAIHATWMSIVMYGVFFTLIALSMELSHIVEVPMRYSVATITFIILSYNAERYFHEGRTLWHIALFSLYTICIIMGGAILLAYWPW